MKDVIGAIFCCCIGLFYLISSLKYSSGTIDNPGPAFLPIILGYLMLFLSGLLLLLSLRKRKNGSRLAEIWEGLNVRNIFSAAMVVAGVTVYLLSINYVGFLFASPVLVFFLAWVMGGNRWVVNIILGIVSAGFAYWLFWIVMRVPIPLGSLWGK